MSNFIFDQKIVLRARAPKNSIEQSHDFLGSSPTERRWKGETDCICNARDESLDFRPKTISKRLIDASPVETSCGED
jgi:hypothetical protein